MISFKAAFDMPMRRRLLFSFQSSAVCCWILPASGPPPWRIVATLQRCNFALVSVSRTSLAGNNFSSSDSTAAFPRIESIGIEAVVSTAICRTGSATGNNSNNKRRKRRGRRRKRRDGDRFSSIAVGNFKTKLMFHG